ncbi:IreB family regulatory phosphoprotein [[Clostridium] colinum]|uniref:IreB family regulatory phosphoprotein n=1 Tax=[Clostridium] colinum TaxID=36835 RepID=UPI00202470BF|nr:IreB family regulatory phosphoprotein [[Clostridium] colinum]
MVEKDLSLTQKFDAYQQNEKSKVDFMVTDVKNAMLEKGYNPVNQIVGYILSGDPTYITSHKGARSIITKIERNELLEEIVKSYLNSL